MKSKAINPTTEPNNPKDKIKRFCEICLLREDGKQLERNEADIAIDYLYSPFSDDDLCSQLIYLLTKGRKFSNWALTASQEKKILKLVENADKQFEHCLWIEYIFFYLYGNYAPSEEDKDELWYRLPIIATHFKSLFITELTYDKALDIIISTLQVKSKLKYKSFDVVASYKQQLKSIFDSHVFYQTTNDYFTNEKIFSGVKKIIEFTLKLDSKSATDLTNKLVWKLLEKPQIEKMCNEINLCLEKYK